MTDRAAVVRLQRLVGVEGSDLGSDHGRWQVYRQAIERPEAFGLLHECVAGEDDPALASSVVVGVLGRVDRSERDAWVGALPPEFADFARRRAEEWGVLEDVLSGDYPGERVEEDSPNWSDWLQLKIVEESADPRVLGHLTTGGRTKRIRRLARESR
ncbi:hypothetical protein [Murinocardiopsis flavida]|uniref:hypothetical protein n=1 Tax=Murinocardiopsis flavida TaxID=645275 RepID=UPI0011B22285|nr:hypothetical protein [Murinocardiopsis flavida]